MMTIATIAIRPATLHDLPEMQKLFVDTVSSICKNDYSPKQIVAWTSSINDVRRSTNKLTSQYFLIAELNDKMAGYASLENNDHLDFLYVHKDHQRQGIASKLYSEIEKDARSKKATVLTSDVSLTARPFFEKNGFRMLHAQTNLIHGVKIVNYKMSKQL